MSTWGPHDNITFSNNIFAEPLSESIHPQDDGSGYEKHGFGVPLGAWFRGELRPLVEDLLLDGPRLGGRLDPAAIRRIFDDHVTGRGDRGHQLWTLLTLELWMRKHAFS